MTMTIKFGNGEEVIYGEGFNERHIARFKAERNRRLAETDNQLVSDRGLSKSKITKWKTYRQELRDLPDNTVFTKDSDGNVIITSGNITGVTWPTKPE